MEPADVSLAAFSVFSFLRVYSYLPQIWKVAVDTNGATAISYSCWSIWIGANGSTAAYAWINLHDPWLAGINAFAALGCTTVLLITCFKRRHW